MCFLFIAQFQVCVLLCMAAYALAGPPVEEKVELIQAPGPEEIATWNALGKAQHKVHLKCWICALVC